MNATLRYTLFLFGIILLALSLVYAFIRMNTPTAPNPVLPSKTITIGPTTLEVELANTDTTREHGLSGRSNLQEGKGMLFVFEQQGNWGFWMKDMNFPIDIIFISETQVPGIGSIVSIAKNVSPNTYPNIFYPPLAVRYVLEVPAGFSDAHGIVSYMTVSL